MGSVHLFDNIEAVVTVLSGGRVLIPSSTLLCLRSMKIVVIYQYF